MRPLRRLLPALALVAASWPAAAQQLDPAARGGELAKHWCAECHATGAERGAADVGPTFPDIAKRRSDDYIRGFLANPHLRGLMPPFDLATAQVEDLVAYLATLR